MIINTIGMKKDKRFEKLYALMGQDLNIIQMPDIAYQYDGSHWEKLLQYSERHYSFCEEKGLLFPVLHKVHWGMYPECEYTYNQKELLMVLEEVVRTDGFSKLTWMEQDYFEHQMCLMLVPHTAYTKAAPSYIKNFAFVLYRKANIYYYLVQKGEANYGFVLILFTRRNIYERNKNQGLKSRANETSGRSNTEQYPASITGSSRWSD